MKTVFKIMIITLLFEDCSSVSIVQMGKSDTTIALGDPNHQIGHTGDPNHPIGYKWNETNPQLLARQNRQQAIDYAQQAILKMNSEDTNELKLARRLFTASLSYYESAQVWNYLGDVSMKESQLNKDIVKNNKLIEAINYYTKSIERDTMNNLSYYHRGLCYQTIGDTTYLSDYQKSCSLGNAEACLAIKEAQKK